MRKLLIVLFSLGAAACIATAVIYAMRYSDGINEYREIEEKAVRKEKKNTDSAVRERPGAKDDVYDTVIDWDAMTSQNSDYAGWIEMMNGASYPVVQAKDNEFYLHTGFNKTYNINGCIFMDCYAQKDWSDRNTIVYGHNMTNGSMFGSNKKYRSREYAVENPYFYIHVKGGYNVYRIYTYILTDDETYPYTAVIADAHDMEEYLARTKAMGEYWIDEAAPLPEDRIVTLSTCIGQAGGIHRQLIQGRFERFVEYGKEGFHEK